MIQLYPRLLEITIRELRDTTGPIFTWRK